MSKRQRHGRDCYCFSCVDRWARQQARRRELEQQRQQRDSRPSRSSAPRQSSWQPRGSQSPDVGVVAGTDHVVSFKTKGDETLIADGDFSDNPAGFDRDQDGSKAHDHYGPWGGTERDRYTGPDS